MKKIGKLTVLALIMLCMTMLLASVSSAADLKDIKGHWAEEYIEYGVEKGYISGYEDGTFLPNKTVTRAEFSKMINNAIKITSTGEAKGDFTDVDKKQWYFEEVKKAEYAGYITGYEDGSFKPGNPITRQEAAVILSRIVLPITQRAELESFGDADKIDSWASDSVSMIAAKGYIKGDDKGNFSPKGALTRAQAAKLICELVKNENIANKDQVVDEDEEKIIFSETLFTDNIVIKAPEGTTVVFKNCRVLGCVTVASEDINVEFENSAAKEVCFEESGSTVTLDKASSVKNAHVKHPSTLVGDGFQNTYIEGEDLSSGTISLKGTFAKVEVSSDATLGLDVVKSLTVSDKVNLLIQSGTVEKLEVKSSAKGSIINLAKKAVVEKAENKGAVKYTGNGTIEVANDSVTGVEYGENVTVEETTGKGSEDKDDKEDSSSKDVLDGMTVSPTDAKKNVSVSSNVTITFKSTVYGKMGEEIDANYVEDNIELRSGSEKGTKVNYKATVTSSKKVVINPTSSLKASTKYYVVIPAKVLKNKNGDENEKFVSYFTTSAALDEDEPESGSSGNDDDDPSVTMSPKNGADDVSVSTSIKLTFDGTLKAYSGTLDEEYIEDEAIEIHEGTKDGDTIKFSATISGKTITLVPSRLLGETDYYVVILGNKLKVGGSTLSKTTLSFTTEEGTAITITPGNGETGVSLKPEITVSFAEPMLQANGEDRLTEEYIQDEVLIIKKGSTKESAEDVYYSLVGENPEDKIPDNNRSFTITPDYELEPGTTYYIIIEEGSLIGEITETENAKVTSNFKTATAMAPMFTPYDGKKNASTGTEIKISFSDDLLVYAKDKADRVAVDDAYLEELVNGDENGKGKNRIYLKRVGASKPLDITLSLEDNRTIVISHEAGLQAEKSYEISIEKNLFYSVSEDGKTYKANAAGKATFDTNIAMSPTITPKNETEGVALTVKPTIEFNEKIYRTDKDGLEELTPVYLKKAITFVDEYNNEVEFSVDIDGSEITVEPEEDLEGNVTYTLTLLRDRIQNEDGIFNLQKIVTFTTKVSNTIEITPASGKASPLVSPTVKFGTELFTIDGDEVTEDYAKEYIFITEGTKSSDYDDAIEAEISIGEDGRTYTIDPVGELDFGVKYYVNVVGKAFLFADEKTENAAKNSYFTVISEPELKKVSASAVNTSSIKITFTSNVSDNSDDELAMLYVDVVKTETGESVEFDPKPIDTTSSTSVTIKKLEKDTEYTFTVYVVYDGEYESEKVEVTAKTKA